MPRSTYDPRVNNYYTMPKVAEIEGVEIHCDGNDGSFWAKVGRDVVSRKNLNELKRLIGQRARSLKVLAIDDTNGSYGYDPSFAVAEIVGVEKSSRERYSQSFNYRLKNGDLKESHQLHLYAYDSTVEAAFTTLQAEYRERKAAWEEYREEWRQRWSAELAKLTRLTPQQVKEMRNSQNEADIVAEGAVPFTTDQESE